MSTNPNEQSDFLARLRESVQQADQSNDYDRDHQDTRSQDEFETALSHLLAASDDDKDTSCDRPCPCEDDESYECVCPEELQCTGCSACGTREDPVNLATGQSESCPIPRPPELSGSYCDCIVTVTMEPSNSEGPVYPFAFEDCETYTSCCAGASLRGGKCDNWCFSDGNGNVITFDKDSGEILCWTKPDGSTMDFVRPLSVGFNQTNRQPVEIITTWDSEGDTYTQSQKIDYFSDLANEELRQCITVRRKKNQGDWNELSRVEFEYYDSVVDGCGRPGELKFEHRQEKKDGQWQAAQSKYYRYYTDDTADGKPGLIKLIVHEENLHRITDPENASDAQLAGCAYVCYKYNDQSQVRWIATKAGAIEKTITYELNPNSDVKADLGNHWKRKAIMTSSDGLDLIVFSNSRGQDLLKHESGDGIEKVTAYRFDERGRQIAVYHPSVFDADAGLYDQSQSDLELRLKTNDGLIEHTVYHAQTDETIGAVEHKVQSRQVQKGSAGTPIILSTTEYVLHKAGLGDQETSIARVSKQTNYRGFEAGVSIDPTVTSYTYTRHPDTNQIKTRTTHLPDVSIDQNGQASTTGNVTVEHFDSFSRLTKSIDAHGFETHYQYDAATNARTKMVQDAGSGGLNLVTDHSVDDHGRAIETLGPVHEVGGQSIRHANWTVHVSETETWTASGYQTSAGEKVLINPVQITRNALDGSVSESISATRGSESESVGPLTSTDSFPQSSWVRWSQTFKNECGVVTETRVYHDIPDDGQGDAVTNYAQIIYGYDERLRQNRVETADGTIRRTVFNCAGLATSQWIGTNDNAATDSDPTGGSASSNDMIQLSSSTYDWAARLIESRTLQNANSADDRVTETHYDCKAVRLKRLPLGLMPA